MLAPIAALSLLAEPNMDNALGHLRASTAGIALVLSGSETAGRTAKSFRAEGYFQILADGTLRAELMNFEGDGSTRTLARTHWVVLDGKTLFSYQARGNQYSSLSIEAEPPLKSIRTANSLVSGKLKTVVQLMQDILNPVEWQPWILQARRSEEGPDLLFSTGTDTGHFYRFRVPETEENQYALTDVWYGYRVPARSVDWHLTVRPGAVPSTISYRFIAPAGARAVALPSSNTIPPN